MQANQIDIYNFLDKAFCPHKINLTFQSLVYGAFALPLILLIYQKLPVDQADVLNPYNLFLLFAVYMYIYVELL